MSMNTRRLEHVLHYGGVYSSDDMFAYACGEVYHHTCFGTACVCYRYYWSLYVSSAILRADILSDFVSDRSLRDHFPTLHAHFYVDTPSLRPLPSRLLSIN